MDLREWLFRKNMSRKEFAEKIDISPGHIVRYIGGYNKISRKLAKYIERATNGEVTIDEVLAKNPEVSYNCKKLRKNNP